MAPDRRHDAWLKFARSVLDVPLGRSREEMMTFMQLAKNEHPALVPIIQAYLDFSEKSVTKFGETRASNKKSLKVKQKHLFDLLREEAFFPRALDLARFASKIFPDIPTNRFSKISREEIAARIVAYMEKMGPKARSELESSMREGLAAMENKPHIEVERQSFLSKWERIIKGIQE